MLQKQKGCSLLTHSVVVSYRDKAWFPSKRNRLRCVRCVWMETGLNALLRPSILLAAANRMLGRSSGNHDWLLANASASV